MFEMMIKQLGDKFWLNVRNALIASGTALLVNGTKGIIDAEHATAIMSPVADIIIGFLMAAAAWAWGNLVAWRTKTVPADTPNVPTVNQATGTIEPPP